MNRSSGRWPCLALCALTLLHSAAGAEDERRPNLVFLLSDDQTTYSLGCYGNPDVQTPNLDQLARDGVLFENHYDTTAICMASRASIMTGMYKFKTGCNFEHGALLREHWQQSYPNLLRASGYRTGFAGKFGFEVTDQPGKKGDLPKEDFDAWGGGPGQTHYNTAKNPSMARYAREFPHSTRSYGAFGRDFIADSAGRDEPFCLSISFKAPHMPATPDPAFDEVYAGRSFRKPANYGRDHGAHFSTQSQMGRQYDRFHSWGYADRYDQVMATYHQQIYAIDVAVGMIRDALSAHGAAENTVIIFTSDNGFLCGSHGYGSKVLPYEEASRVPLILLDPRHPSAGKEIRCEALTGNVDFAPTLLRLAGIEPPPNLDGRSLLPLLDDPSAEIHPHLPLINVWGPRKVHSFGVVTRDWKYVYWPNGEGDLEPAEELYHLDKDPLELTNRTTHPEYREALETMRAAYDEVLTQWKAEAVPYHNYQPFGRIFDRSLPWEDKAALYR